MIPLLSGILGQVKVITGRLTSARAGYLDNLNTNLAVLPAPASTALSTATWTSGLATRLGGAGISQTQEYTTGSGNWTVPANVTLCWVTLQAAGGSGAKNASGGGGGGSGEMAFRIPYKVTGGGTVAYSVGAGAASSNGGNTTFGTLSVEGGKYNAGTGGASGGGPLGSTTPSAIGTWAVSRMGGGAGGSSSNAGAPSAAYAGGAAGGTAGGGAASWFAQGGAGSSGSTPTQPGVGAGSGGTTTGATTVAGGNGYILIEWVG
jgi:hypothetical protein